MAAEGFKRKLTSIYSNGVNVATRLEVLADLGGICVSKTTLDQIDTKLPLGYEKPYRTVSQKILKPVDLCRAAWGTESGS